MSDRVPIDDARLRAAVADERYWRPGHPERAAWQAWVGDGYRALYDSTPGPTGGVVHVRAYVRDGHMVAAHTRSASSRGGAQPVSQGGGAAPAGRDTAPARPPPGGLRELAVSRRSLLESGATVPAMAPREDRFGGGRRSPVEDGARGGGGGFRPPGATRPSQAPASPPVSRRSQELVDMVAPKGRPVGEKKGYARESVRTLPGGRPAAEQFLKRLTEGRNPVDITPRGYPGRLYRLDDGSVIGYRPSSRSGGPSIDVNIPGFSTVRRLHF